MIRVLLMMLLLPVAAISATLVPNGRVVWDEPLERFGGLSGIEVSGDGHFLAISDRGMFFEGVLLHENGALTGVSLTGQTPVLDSKGAALRGHNADGEGLAIGSGGRIFTSFEANHRVMVQENISQGSDFLPKHPDFRGLQNNSGLEALAIAPDGVLFAIPERSGKLTRPFPLYRYDGGGWDTPVFLPRRGAYLVTGADFDPDGRLYVLERDFTWLGGFKTRVRRFVLQGNGITAEETLLETPVGLLDNMEGISVWVDSGGTLRVTLISDDNFNPLQRTIVAEYLVQD